MANEKRTLNQVLEAIKDSGGVKFVVARRLGIARPTLDRYLARWPKAMAAIVSEDEDTGDMAESVIKRNIELALHSQIEKKLPGDSSDAWRWLASRRKEKFSTRQEITGADGKPLNWREFIEGKEKDADPGAGSQ